MRVLEGEEKEEVTENIFEEIMAENFLNVWKNNNLYIQEAKQTPNRINTKRSTNRLIRVKILKVKDKEKLLKAVKRKTTHHLKGTPIRLTMDS